MGVFVPIWLVLRRCEATNLGVFDLCHFALISPYLHGAVQVRVGLELAEEWLDDRQITHLTCVRLKHLLYDFLGGVVGLLPVIFLI